MGLYDYNQVYQQFQDILAINSQKASQKKQKYLEKIVSIFTKFVKKCQKEIDSILNKKINQISNNYINVKQYMSTSNKLNVQQTNLIIAEFLIKPFQKFPFSGDKNQKIFKQQYNFIQKASVLIEQTLIDSFNEDQVPKFENNKFFKTLQNYGLGQQSLTKLRLNSHNFKLSFIESINPLNSNIKSMKSLHSNLVALVGTSSKIQIWDLYKKVCVKQLYTEAKSSINCLCRYINGNINLLVIGFGDESPQIWCYRMDNWMKYGFNITHTRKITKILQVNKYLISGSADGNLCIHTINPFKTVVQAPHVSSIEDIINKNSYLYILMKNSTICEYDLICSEGQITLQFRRTLSTGYISIIRYPQLTSNFAGVACHIYGLSQIQITRKFKLEQINIINVVQMIADFVVLQSKQTSQFFAICAFQNSSILRIYSLLSQQLVYELQSDDQREVGVGGYLPKLQLLYMNEKYILVVIAQSESHNERNIIKLYQVNL